MSYIIKEKTEENIKKLYLDYDKELLVNTILESDAYVNHSRFGISHITITLCSDDFLQSVDIATVVHPDENVSLTDFTISNHEDLQHVTVISAHPYKERPELSKKTGRDYKNEIDSCFNYITSLI